MTNNPAAMIGAALLLVAAPALASSPNLKLSKHYSPPTNSFSCLVPREWYGFEEEEPTGFVTHLLGPDNPGGTFRTGIDIHRMEKGTPGFVSYSKAIKRMRKSGGPSSRHATPLAYTQVAGNLGILFEVTERRWLADERLAAEETAIHHFICVVPDGENYWIIRLSSTRDVFLNYRQLFRDFLSNFRPLGYSGS